MEWGEIQEQARGLMVSPTDPERLSTVSERIYPLVLGGASNEQLNVEMNI